MSTGQLGDHVEILSGFAFKSDRFNDEGRGLPLVRIRDVKPARSQTYFDGDYDARFVLSDGDLLVGMDGEFNCARWAGGPALLNQRVCRVRSASQQLDEQYLFWFLPKALKDIEDRSNFVTVKHLSAKQINEIEIPLPPLDEQKRIAAILDQADELRRKRQRAIERLNQLGQAIFHEMFGDIGRLDRTHAFSDVATIQQSLVDPKLPEYSSELHVGPEHIGSGVGIVAWDKVRTAADDLVISGKNRFKSGDIIYSKIRPYLNKVAIADRDGLCSADMYVIQPIADKSNAAFLRMLLMGADFLAYAETCSNRANIPKLNRSQVEGYRFNCPPFEAQKEFAERVTEIEMMSASLAVATKSASSLFASLQNRAFEGGL